MAALNTNPTSKFAFKTGSGPKNVIKSGSVVNAVAKTDTNVVVTLASGSAKYDTCANVLKVLVGVDATACASLVVLVNSEEVVYTISSSEVVEDYLIVNVAKQS